MMNPHQTELGELKEVIGKLWKSIDSLKLSMVESDQRTQQQITEWTQINLQLLQLLADKTQEAALLAQNSDRLASYLTTFDRDSQNLNQQIATLSNALQQFKQGSQKPQDESLQECLSLVETAIVQMSKKFQHLFNGSYVLERQSSTWIYSINLFLSLAAAIGLFGFTLTHRDDQFRFQQIQSDLEFIRERSKWTITKLERLENR
jgi:ABC-type transporter Mla subunit MlaD